MDRRFLIQAFDAQGRYLGLRRVEEGYSSLVVDGAVAAMDAIRTLKSGFRLTDSGEHKRGRIARFTVAMVAGGAPETYTRDRFGDVFSEATGRYV